MSIWVHWALKHASILRLNHCCKQAALKNTGLRFENVITIGCKAVTMHFFHQLRCGLGFLLALDVCARIYTTRFPHCQESSKSTTIFKSTSGDFSVVGIQNRRSEAAHTKPLTVLSRARKVLWRRDRKWTDRWLQHSALDTRADTRAFDQRKGNIYRNNCTFGDVVYIYIYIKKNQ